MKTEYPVLTSKHESFRLATWSYKEHNIELVLIPTKKQTLAAYFVKGEYGPFEDLHGAKRFIDDGHADESEDE